MNDVYRDCDIKTLDGDITWIGRALLFYFHKKDNSVGKIKYEFEEYSFLIIKSCFNGLRFGGCKRGIYCATPAEILHAVLLRLCDYIAECMELTFTNSAMDLISHDIVRIQDSRRKIKRDLPDLGLFRHRLMSVKSLKIKDLFLCLLLILNPIQFISHWWTV